MDQESSRIGSHRRRAVGFCRGVSSGIKVHFSGDSPSDHGNERVQCEAHDQEDLGNTDPELGFTEPSNGPKVEQTQKDQTDRDQNGGV